MYAIQLGAQLGADLQFFHAYEKNRKSQQLLPSDIAEALQQQGEFAAQKYFLKYLKHLRAELNQVVSVQPLLKAGKAAQLIPEIGKQEGVDLIVMGAGNARSFSKKVLGNVATSVLKRSQVPLLMVPQEAEWRPIKHIVYGTRFEETGDRVPDVLDLIAEAGGGHISCVNIRQHEKGKQRKHPIMERIFRLQEDPSNRIFFYTMRHRGVLVGLQDFGEMYKCDLLSVLNPSSSSYQNWIKSSLSRDLLFRTKVPLLVAANEEDCPPKKP